MSISIDKESGKASLTFNLDFYDISVITEALNDYKDVCECSLSENVVTLIPEDKELLDIIGNEFYNYVLGNMKNIENG